MAIPVFPDFKGLEQGDRTYIDSFTKSINPLVSDFCFSTLALYDLEGKTRWSVLNEHLVIGVPNGLNPSGPYLMFCGDHSAVQTAECLLNEAPRLGYPAVLHRIPENTAQAILRGRDRFSVTEERDHFDYIFSAESLCTLEGPVQARLRKRVGKFHREFPSHQIVILEWANLKVRQRMEFLIDVWLERKASSALGQHYAATIRELLRKPVADFRGIGVEIDGQLVGYAIVELIEPWALYHFAISDPSFQNLTRRLLCAVAEHGRAANCLYINSEEDGGDLGLRFFKEACAPAGFARKYRVAYADN